jgi:NAD(P)-dependent dehydrogenase (short-subunit alcohol dehydrogenase family)
MPFAFLTGGGRIIGEGITRQLMTCGWTLAVTDIDLDLARKVAARRPPRVETFILNATKGAEAKKLMHSLLAHHGAIVGIAASWGPHSGPQASIYSAAKAAIIVFSQSLAQEVDPHGIRVNSIAPGNAEARWKKPEPVRSPLGRATTGDDIGRAVAFLLSDDVSHITGRCLDLSGGTTLH